MKTTNKVKGIECTHSFYISNLTEIQKNSISQHKMGKKLQLSAQEIQYFIIFIFQYQIKTVFIEFRFYSVCYLQNNFNYNSFFSSISLCEKTRAVYFMYGKRHNLTLGNDTPARARRACLYFLYVFESIAIVLIIVVGL